MFFAPIGNVENQIEALLSLSAEKPFLDHSLSKAEAFVLLRFVKAEDGAAGASGSPQKSEAQKESALYADNKVSQAYDYFFRTRYEESEKKKKIVISADKVAQIQQAIQQQL
jgi:hypothetical protein